MAVYASDKVESEKLIERLNCLKSIEHESLSKVSLIY